jgi:hypothetical protein
MVHEELERGCPEIGWCGYQHWHPFLRHDYMDFWKSTENTVHIYNADKAAGFFSSKKHGFDGF